MDSSSGTTIRSIPSRIETVTFQHPDVPAFVFDKHFLWPGYPYHFEVITPNSTGGRVWKNFQHYKRWCPSDVTVHNQLTCSEGAANNRYPRGVSTDPYGLYDGEFGPPGELDASLEPYYQVGSWGFIPPPDDLDSLKQASLSEMMPGIKTEMSLLNFLYELKDFKSLPATLRRLQSFTQILRNLGKNPELALRRLFHSASDVYLQTQFNIMPLLSDLHAIWQAVHRTEARLNELVANAGRPRMRHFMRIIGNAGNETSSTEWHGYGSYFHNLWTADTMCPGQTKLTRIVYASRPVFHAQMQYCYNLTAYQAEHARLFAILDAFGIKPDPRIIWNAIPWSFAVDWVFGVNRWLSQFASGNMDPVVNIQNYLWSVTKRRTIVVRLDNKPDSDLFGTPLVPTSVTLPVVNEKAYRRDVGLPSESSIVSSGLSLKEFSLAAALIIPRAWRPKKKHKK